MKNDNTIAYIEHFLNEDSVIEEMEPFLNEDYVSFKENLQTLLKNYKRKSSILEKIIKQSDREQLKMMKLNAQLDDHKNHLEKKILQEIDKRKEKEKMLMQQARLASMSEMMDSVAHQWKQPISVMSMQVEMMGDDFENNLVDASYVQNFQEEINAQIQHMTYTLNEFRTFFRPNKDTMNFNAKEMIDAVLLLTKDEFMMHSIEIVINTQDDFSLYGIENEFKHLIINLINNSKDAFIENNIKNRKITINLLLNNEDKIIEVIDNAGGIPQDLILNIFKANITSKKDSKGTGIGLYLSTQIAQKHKGTLNVENTLDGAKFIFKLLPTSEPQPLASLNPNL